MNRITSKFRQLRETGRKGLVGYLTAGDPNPTASLADVRTAIANGLDVVELGVPFSDPTADGPTIQEASQHALAAGMTVGKAIEMVAALRRESDIPLVLFGYANPFFRYGYEKVCADAAEAGVDGMLVVDLPFEEAGELRACAERHGMALIPLVAPTTPLDRARTILKDAKGFVYYVMVTGVTGTRDQVVTGLVQRVGALRACTDLPVAAGFGIRNGDQARIVAAAADAVVVGSALVEAAATGNLAALVRELRAALDAPH